MSRADIRRRIVDLLLPGVGRVRSQVPRFADAWLTSNAEALSAQGPLWVALGDSLSQGIGADSITGGWVGQLRAQLHAEGCPVRLVNLSATGARVRDVIERQLPQLSELAVAPALVTVLIGANDMFPRGRRADAVVAYPRLLAALPPGRSLVGTLPRRNSAGLAINALIEEAAADGCVDIADLRGLSMSSLIGNRAEDHFHPNERGYGHIAGCFAAAVDRAMLC